MTTSAARPLILTAGLMMAIFDVVALLPGNPDFSSRGGVLLSVALQALVVWRLLHRSGLAWALAVLVPALYPVTLVLMAADWETTAVLTCAAAFLQIVILFTPPVVGYVFGRNHPVASH